jgi:hypothetical protein
VRGSDSVGGVPTMSGIGKATFLFGDERCAAEEKGTFIFFYKEERKT